jgi:hypothetical protein
MHSAYHPSPLLDRSHVREGVLPSKDSARRRARRSTIRSRLPCDQEVASASRGAGSLLAFVLPADADADAVEDASPSNTSAARTRPWRAASVVDASADAITRCVRRRTERSSAPAKARTHQGAVPARTSATSQTGIVASEGIRSYGLPHHGFARCNTCVSPDILPPTGARLRADRPAEAQGSTADVPVRLCPHAVASRVRACASVAPVT